MTKPIGLDRIKKGFAKRLNEALDDFGAPPKNKGRAQFLSKLMSPMSATGVQYWLLGTNMPRLEQQPILAEKLRVRLEWLIYDLGPKHEPLVNGEKDSTQKGFNAVLMQRIMSAVEQAMKEQKLVDEKLKMSLTIRLYESLQS